jgi:molecular chaperone HtpG
MTSAEVEKYINQLVFRCWRIFRKYKDSDKDSAKDSGIIGHFGLGFILPYASTVEITKSYKDEPAAHWTCDGSPEFTLEPADKTTRGTEIILHIAEDSLEFLKKLKSKNF